MPKKEIVSHLNSEAMKLYYLRVNNNLGMPSYREYKV